MGGAKDGSGGDPNGLYAELWANELASRGYVAVSINYAITDPGPVAAFLQCEWDPPQALGPPCPPQIATTVRAAQYDTQAAVRWLRDSASAAGNPFRIRASRIMVLGASAGATVALDTLYRPDDPGSVGITTGDSSVSAAVALAVFTNSTYVRAGAGPALLMTYTNDVLGELYGFDMYDAARELVQRAQEVGVTTELDSYCQRADVTGDGIPAAPPGRSAAPRLRRSGGARGELVLRASCRSPAEQAARTHDVVREHRNQRAARSVGPTAGGRRAPGADR